MYKITHLKSKDIKELRLKILKENNNICPILKIPLDEKNAVLDHIHKAKQTDDITPTSGVIRDTIHNGANCFLGKIENAYKRYIPKDVNLTLPELLRLVADYVEKGAYVENNTIFSHPIENAGGDLIKIKKIPFSKTLYNKLKISCKENKVKIPAYNKIFNTRLYELCVRFNLLSPKDLEKFKQCVAVDNL